MYACISTSCSRWVRENHGRRRTESDTGWPLPNRGRWCRLGSWHRHDVHRVIGGGGCGSEGQKTEVLSVCFQLSVRESSLDNQAFSVVLKVYLLAEGIGHDSVRADRIGHKTGELEQLDRAGDCLYGGLNKIQWLPPVSKHSIKVIWKGRRFMSESCTDLRFIRLVRLRPSSEGTDDPSNLARCLSLRDGLVDLSMRASNEI